MSHLQLPVEPRPVTTVTPDYTRERLGSDWSWAADCSSWLRDWSSFTARYAVTRPFFLSCGFFLPNPGLRVGDAIYTSASNKFWVENGVDESKITMPKWPEYEAMHPVAVSPPAAEPE